ncbi:hypothetical protein COY32_01530, partial [candidate division WWE3 bacterium CG_4_10_14_0_2_um_filter_41_14]
MFDWSPLDAKLDNAHRKNMEIVGLIIGTPQWAGSTPGLEHRILPGKSFENDYKEFLRKLAARYPYITKYEFWNEQNGCGSGEISQSCGFSDASIEEYAYWLNATYATLKSVNPSLLISVGGLDGADVDFINALHTKNGGRSYDVVSVHPYNWTGKADLEGVARVKNASFAQEMWLTEFGWDLTRITEDQQAEYLRETYKELTSGSYNYITVALLLSIVDYSEKLGIMNTNADGTFTPRPAYEVFTTFQQNCTIGDDGQTGLPPIVEGWIHPGIDIEPNSQNAQSNNVYSTHAGFVTYAGPAPPTVAEKGWMVQIESDVDRDNVPDYITRYTHLLSGSTILINDVHYIRRSFTPECFMD